MADRQYARISELEPIDRDPLDSDLIEIETGAGGSGYMPVERFRTLLNANGYDEKFISAMQLLNTASLAGITRSVHLLTNTIEVPDGNA
jgi:hypothetical protein